MSRKPHIITLPTPQADMWEEICKELDLLFNVTNYGMFKVVRSYGTQEELEVAWKLYTEQFDKFINSVIV